MSKVSKLFRLSEEAVAVLATKSNATQYIEDLILGEQSHAITFKQMYDLLEQFAKDHLDGLALKQVSPDPVAGLLEEMSYPPCCKLERNCKHWVWDSGSAQFVNSLTGAARSAPDF